MYNFMTNWKIKYIPYAHPYGIYVSIKTNDFYGTKRKLDLEIFTFRNDPTKIWVCNIGQLEYQARRHHIKHDIFVEMVHQFGLDYYQGQVQYSGHANGLETAMFKLLNFARYIDEDNVEIPSPRRAHENQIGKIFVKDKHGNVQTRVD